MNGYYKSGNTYRENNRIKKMEISFKLKDVDERFSYPVGFGENEYHPLYFENLISVAKWIDFFDYACISEIL